MKGTCWNDESRGLKQCQREVIEVKLNGYAVAGCARCKTLLGDPVAPATRNAQPFADGWRQIPKDYLPRT